MSESTLTKPETELQISGTESTDTPEINESKPIGSHTQDAEPAVKLSKFRFTVVLIALFLGVLLSALDQTILSTAVPVLSTEFQSADLIPWVGIAYLLTSSAFSSIYGKMADIFGRKATFVSAIAIFEIGSLVCGLAPNMATLIAGRAIAGIGGGGIVSLVLIIISDIVTFRERGKYQGIIASAFGVASVVGPLAGGAFTDSSATWRWCFYINLPLGGFVLLVVIFFLRFPKTSDSTTFASRLKRVDYLGVVLILASVVCFILPLQLGGTRWKWSDPQTIAMLVVSVVLLGVTVYVEGWVAQDPIIPGSVFVNSTVYGGVAFAFFMGAGFISVIYYIAIFLQVVQGDSATSSGIKTIPLMAGLIFTSITTGIMISRGVPIRLFVIIGGVLLTVSDGLLTLLNESIEYWKIALITLAFGISVGSMMQSRTLAVQAAVPHSMIAVVTSLATFSQMLGGSVGLTVFGTVFNNRIYEELIAQLPPQYASIEFVRTLANEPLAVSAIVAKIPNGAGTILPIYRHCFSAALRIAFFSVLPCGVLILVCAAFLNHIPSTKPTMARKRMDAEAGKAESSAEAAPLNDD
ncbi:major facilitator superfamily domain-containing protein [Cladochytrium replicatum]|nr:major facilitator superfamily domain-containing protein [Cladochytrium replicatum]